MRLQTGGQKEDAQPFAERSDGIARTRAGLTQDMHRVTEGFELRHQWLDPVTEQLCPGRIIDQKVDGLSMSPSQLDGNLPEGFSIPRGCLTGPAKQEVGDAVHRGADRDHPVAPGMSLRDDVADPADGGGIPDGGAAELHDNEIWHPENDASREV
jgi:hypothetical protein